MADTDGQAITQPIRGSEPHGIDMYEVEMQESGEAKSFVGSYDVDG